MADLLLHPALPLLAAALLCLVLPARAGRVVVVVAPLVALVQLSLLEPGTSVTGTWLDFDVEVLRADRLARAFGVIFAIAAGIAGTYGLRTQSPRERTSALTYAGAAMAVVFAGDLLTFFVAWEIKAIASTFLVLQRRGGNSGRAGMRYLFVHVLGGKLLLAGVLWHLAETGSLAFESFAPSPATVLILLACALSAAIPPLHAWLPDAYPEASIAGTVFLSAYTTKAAVYALARGFAGWEVLIWVGVVMALYGVVYAVLENDVRRLLGYHIISQVGYMVAAVGIGTELAINGATAHAFAHILYKGLLLMGVGAVIHATGRSKMTELGGIANRMRPVLALYMVGAVSISSFPLFSGFVSKELAVQGASAAGFGAAVVLLKVASVGTFLHTGLKLPYGTWFGPQGPGPRTDAGQPFRVGPVPPSMYVAMAISAALNLAIGVRPALLYQLMPFEVTYDVYTLGKVVETSQILLFTALASWLLLDRLGAKAMISLDADWFYRRLPRRMVEARLPRLTRRAPVEGPVADEPAPAGLLVRARALMLERAAERPPGAPPPVAATWLLGTVILGSGVLLLGLSLVVRV
ncbi:Na(+)/H(+) antiporter subunit D [Nitriliruptor alkaliphilus]|uniref:Na(+)/H(+) antiporter subunit D n=1 Tax=Nitriliruptor alkaliphilus TaxID=427918 RepID=UPI000696EA8B|nr:Na(+)/H(+) antiporter subunit D [Nitriliruptor alkaliphilus]